MDLVGWESGGMGEWGLGGEKHETYAAAFCGNLFLKDLFLQDREGWVGMASSPPLPHDPQLNNRLALSPGVPPPLKNSGSAITTGIDHTRAR